MDFVKENKVKLIATATAAAVGGIIWLASSQQLSLEKKLEKLINEFTSKINKSAQEVKVAVAVADSVKETKPSSSASSILKTKLIELLSERIQRGKTDEEKEAELTSFFLQGFSLYFKEISSLDDTTQSIASVAESYRDLIGIFLQIAASDEACGDSAENGIKSLILTCEVSEKIDTFDFIFSSLHFIREADLMQFLEKRVLQQADPKLRHIFLQKLIKHAHTCLHIDEKSEQEPTTKLSDASFFFSDAIIDLTKDKEFLKTLDVQSVQVSITLFNHFATTFNKNIQLFTLKEPFLLKWQKLLRNIIPTKEFISHVLEMKQPNLLAELFKQLVYSLFIFTVSYNLEDAQIDNYSELYQKRLLPYCSVMIIAEESLKLLDEFLNAVKHSGVLFKYKTAFVTVLHDFMATLIKFYKDNNCSNYHNLLNCSITLLIIHCHSTLPSSLSLSQFWKESLLPQDCNIKTISEPYFRMNLAPFFEITGMIKIVEQLVSYYEADAQKKIRIFLQIMNNKKATFNRLKVLGYQFSILQEDFEDTQIQQMIVKHLFSAEETDIRAVSFKMLHFCEKIVTPLHLINQMSIESLSNEEEKELVSEQVAKFSNEAVQYLTNVFKLANQDLPIEEALIYVRNGVYANLTLAELSKNLDPTASLKSCVLKKEQPLQNLMELFFDKQMSFEGFQEAEISQDISKSLYDSLDFVQEIQYRLFTKPFFMDFAEKCIFLNPHLTTQFLTHSLVLYEIILDYLFNVTMSGKETSTPLNPLNQTLLNRVLGTKEIFQNLKEQVEPFSESHPHAKKLNAQLMIRIEARLNQISKL